MISKIAFVLYWIGMKWKEKGFPNNVTSDYNFCLLYRYQHYAIKRFWGKTSIYM